MSTTPLLEARNIRRRFGHVEALAGADCPDEGEILIDGKPVSFSDPASAQARGIATVYQDLALAPELTPADNLFLGRERMRPGLLGTLGFLDRPSMRRMAAEQFQRLGVKLRSASVPVSSLSGGQRQSVAIARAAMWANKVIFMDEPTAALGVMQTGRVLDLIRQVRDQGITVVLISHNMRQVLKVADRVEVLRLGKRVAQFDTASATVESLVGAMTAGGAGIEEDAA